MYYASGLADAHGTVSRGRSPSLHKAIKDDPLNARAWAVLGRTLVLQGDQAAAHTALERSLEISPAANLCTHGARDQLPARRTSRRGAEDLAAVHGEVFRLYGAALAHYDLKHPPEADQALNTLIAKYGTTAAFQIAEVYAWRGDKLRAMFWLERAHAQKDAGYTFIKVDPLLRNLHDDPHYHSMLVVAKLN